MISTPGRRIDRLFRGWGTRYFNSKKGGVWAIALLLGLLQACQPVPSAELPAPPTPPTPPAQPNPTPPPPVTYQRQVWARSVVHVVTVPAGGRFEVVPAVATGVQTVAEFADRAGAIAVLNAGYFDPANQMTTSHIIRTGQQVANPRQNPRLMGNPDLAPYLDRILDRSELRRYQCGQESRYAIARHSAPVPPDCVLRDALGAGPQLLPQLTAEPEGFTQTVEGRVVRDAIGSDRPNARSAVGITTDGRLVLVMVAQVPESPGNSGMTLTELATLLKTLGASQALNLDGGSSTSLYYDGQSFYGRLSMTGERVQRPVKSVLLVLPGVR